MLVGVGREYGLPCLQAREYLEYLLKESVTFQESELGIIL